MSNTWDKYLDPRDSKIYSGAGLGTTYGLGKNPALIIVDVQYGFTGEGPEEIEEAIKKYPTSCGSASWEAIPQIKRVLDKAREKKLPVFFTIIEGNKGCDNDRIAIKGNIFNHPLLLEGEKGTKVVEELAPIEGEITISKKKPSAFFGTPIVSYLTAHGVDSVIITGCTTSGCVRATVIDAFSNNYKVIVPEECVFDRGITTHAINLFDMQQKYADVVSTDDVIEQMNKLEREDVKV
ncbi:isochorismatase family protein [Peribacillus saganii]|uniref:Isochorismatase family protein n=1 Tax=Peribacillus saganii TaxID=2303992 RepID=A0A372LR32_9BACI|nr:isochorismatase family protein [Peribacillus saganii]RFU70506.1 isochorismatase family protein [Peribacillus saganii]